MTELDPEGFTRGGPDCTCGSLYTYAGTVEPGQYAPDCPEHGDQCCPMCGAKPGTRCLTKNGKKRGRPHSARTNPTQKESTMPTSQAVVITDRDRRPDERVKVQPFRHPWIKGTDTDPECGRTWHNHGWIDRGDHGFTVCPTEAERPDVAEARVREAVAEIDRLRAALDIKRAQVARVEALVAQGGDYHWFVVDAPEGEYVQEGSPCVSVDAVRDALEGGERDPDSEAVDALLRQVAADAWDEGYRLDWTGGVKHINPYRTGADQ